MSDQNVNLDYRCSSGEASTLRGCTMTVDKAGRYWLWSSQLESNLAYKARTRDECLLNAVDSLLFTIQLRDERIAALQRVADLATAFADKIKADEGV
jgi:hypothetical protein